MALSMYGSSIPAFQSMLRNMLVWFDKAQAHAEARRFPADNYLGLRIAPDMLPFASQVRIACDTAKATARRLAAVDAPVHADDETTLEQLRARILSTLEYLDGVPADKFEGSEVRAVELPRRNAEPLKFDGEGYLRQFALPNFYFHATMTYTLLRHAGVELGKSEFLRGAA